MSAPLCDGYGWVGPVVSGWACSGCPRCNANGYQSGRPPMTPSDRVREAREAVEELREELLETMWDGNHPLVDYYGPNDPVWEKHKRRCRAENEAELDAYAEAIRAECAAAWRAAIEGMRREHDLDCALRTPLPASGTVSCALTCSCPAGERNALLARLSAIDAARASEPRGRE